MLNLIGTILIHERSAPDQLPQQASWKPALRVLMLHENKQPPDAPGGHVHSTTQSEPQQVKPNHALRLVATRFVVFGWASSEARCTAAVSYLLSFEQPVEETES